MLALRLPPELEKRLDDLARKTGRTKSSYAREALIEHIDDLEDLEDLYLVQRRVEENGPRVPLDAMIEKYGLGTHDET
ncbi:MAG: TraY domain-containing protein [Nitratireductor sp.]